MALPHLPAEVFELSLEQQAMLAICTQSAAQMSAEELRELLLRIMPQYMIKQNVITYLIKHNA